jgi:signal transduction histidine kinase
MWTQEERPSVSKGTGVVQRPPQKGWIPWYSGSRLYLLCWVEPATSELRYGAEVEMATLIANLLYALPSELPTGQAIALVDGNGRIVHQRGIPVDAELPTLASVPLNSALPHWQVTAYAQPSQTAAAAHDAFTVLAGVLVTIFVAAIITGGSLLLRQAHRDAQDAQRKTSFVSNVSHELKTPLTTIRMYAELVGEGRVHDDSKKRRYLDVIVKESQRLTRLVNNVLDFSRLEQRRKKYRPERLDLAGELVDVIARHAVRFRDAGMTVNQDIPPHACPIHADRDSLEQSILNILDNAIKYASSGGRLAVRVEDTGTAYRVHFCDRGPGVPPAHTTRIFEQFHRGDDSLTATQPGCGLGLSISRGLLRDQGGDLSYRPAPGGGACFTITLPKDKGVEG